MDAIWNLRASTNAISDSDSVETASNMSMEEEPSLLAGVYETFDFKPPTACRDPRAGFAVNYLKLDRGQLINFKAYQALYKRAIEPMDTDITTETPAVKTQPLTPTCGPYRVYSAKDVEKLRDRVTTKGYTVAAAGRKFGIKERTAQGYVAQFYKDEEQRVPIPGSKHRKGGNRKLFQYHTDSLVAFSDDDPTHTLAEANFALEEKFAPMTISGLRNHLRSHCMLTLKKAQIISEARNSPRTRQLRREKLLEWYALEDFNFLNSCVFLDEAGSNLHLHRGFGWATCGKTSKLKVSASKGTHITIMGAICELGIVNLTLRKPTISSATGKKVKAGAKTEDFWHSSMLS